MIIDVTQIADDNSADYVYEVKLKPHGYSYKVRLSSEYCQKLTGGKVDGQELVKKSFDFLLENESPESILKEFDLPVISQYYPDYEQEIHSRI